MPKEPPSDDPILDSILKQLRMGLEDSDFDDDEVKDDLISGVQDSLRALFSMGISEMEPHQKPSVTVVEGGLEIPNDAGTDVTIMASAAAIVRLDLP